MAIQLKSKKNRVRIHFKDGTTKIFNTEAEARAYVSKLNSHLVRMNDNTSLSKTTNKTTSKTTPKSLQKVRTIDTLTAPTEGTRTGIDIIQGKGSSDAYKDAFYGMPETWFLNPKIPAKYWDSDTYRNYLSANNALANGITSIASMYGYAASPFLRTLMNTDMLLNGANNLASENGLSKTYNLFKNGDYTGGLKSAAGDLWDLAKMAPGIYQATRFTRAIPSYLENVTPRMTVTPEGATMINPGEEITLNGRPIGYLEGAAQGSSRYSSGYTTRTGSRGSASGQSYRAGRSYNSAGPNTGVLNRVMSDTRTGRGSTSTTIGFGEMNKPEISSLPIFPYITNLTMTPPDVIEPVVVPPTKPDIRYEEITPYEDPFITWYRKLPEGTTLYFEGDDNSTHKAGAYLIKRTKADPKMYRRRVANDEGYVANDSTTYHTGVEPFKVVQLQGGVSSEDTNVGPDKIVGFKLGGKLIKKRFKF